MPENRKLPEEPVKVWKLPEGLWRAALYVAYFRHRQEYEAYGKRYPFEVPNVEIPQRDKGSRRRLMETVAGLEARGGDRNLILCALWVYSSPQHLFTKAKVSDQVQEIDALEMTIEKISCILDRLRKDDRLPVPSFSWQEISTGPKQYIKRCRDRLKVIRGGHALFGIPFIYRRKAIAALVDHIRTITGSANYELVANLLALFGDKKTRGAESIKKSYWDASRVPKKIETDPKNPQGNNSAQNIS